MKRTDLWEFRHSGFGFSNPEDGTDRLSRNVGKKSPPLAA